MKKLLQTLLFFLISLQLITSKKHHNQEEQKETQTQPEQQKQPEQQQQQESQKTEIEPKNACKNPQELPGLQELGKGVDLLHMDLKDSVFQFECSSKTYSLDGQNQIYDKVKVDPLFQLNQQQKTLIAETSQQYEAFKLSTFNTNIDTKLCPEYADKLDIVAGELNPATKKILENLQSENQVYQVMSSKYKTYQAEILNSGNMKLSTVFHDELLKLPLKYDKKTHIGFLEKYGTHFREGVVLGGMITQTGYTSTLYQDSDDMGNMATNFDQYYAQELLNKKLSINHIPNSLLNPLYDSNYVSSTSFDSLSVEGGTQDHESLHGWVQTLSGKPVVVEQRLLNISSLITPQNFPNNEDWKNLPTIKDNINQALKDYLINSSGCADKNALNYNPDAKIPDNSCYYSIFNGAYQIPDEKCDPGLAKKYTIPNPITQTTSCPFGTVAEKVALYTIENSCDLTQYFCIRKDIKESKRDLYQSLQICQARSFSNVFFKEEQQYICSQDQKKLEFRFKDAQKKAVYTCRQQFCYEDKSQGIQSFAQKHVGSCQGYSFDKSKEQSDAQCSAGCLVQYGKVKLEDNCDLEQYACIKNTFNLNCINNS